MGKLTWFLEEKARIIKELSSLLSPEARRRAERDHHARRRPRPCGMTIHTGTGCSFGCVYCYVPDMGFSMKPRPYTLEPLELVYALAVNPYVVPYRTFAAYGSVTEPFLCETRERAVQYIVEVYRWLKLPSQVSTKACIDGDTARMLRKGDPRLNVLISVTTLSLAKRLEPRAPDPIERLRCAAATGFSTTLFVRPVIPGVTERDLPRILEVARAYGIRTVVFGALRVTPGILRRLSAAGVDTATIEARLTRRPRGLRDQVPITLKGIRPLLVAEARKRGFVVLPSACAANVYAHGDFCYMCSFGPCGDPSRELRFSDSDVEELAEYMGIRTRVLRTAPGLVEVAAKPGRDGDRSLEVFRVVLSTIVRRRVVLRISRPS